MRVYIPVTTGFLYSPTVVTMKYGYRSGGDEIRLLHTIMPLAIYHFSSLLSLILTLSSILSIYISIYLYPLLSLSLLSAPYTRVYYNTLTHSDVSTAYSLCVRVTYFSPTLRNIAADYSLTATNATRDL